MLGFDRIPEGDTVGWFDKAGHVSFDIFADNPEHGKRFIEGEADLVLIHFNVDEIEGQNR